MKIDTEYLRKLVDEYCDWAIADNPPYSVTMLETHTNIQRLSMIRCMENVWLTLIDWKEEVDHAAQK